MEILKQVLQNTILENKDLINIDIKFDVDKAFENTALRTLEKIRNILDDDTLDDFECIDRIVMTLDEANIYTNRHDF